MIYSTSLQFISLDKTRDEGNYTCIANLNTAYEVQELVLSQSLAISSKCLKLVCIYLFCEFMVKNY